MDQHSGTALWGTLDDATAAQLRCSLSHRGEAHASATLCGDTDAVVDDLQRYIVIHGDPHNACLGPGMSRYVGKRLLRDAVDGHLYCCGEVGKVLRSLH